MCKIYQARRHFPPAIIRHAVWLYLRFALSCRDVEDLPAERGIDASYETVRRWTLKFGAAYARRIRQRRPRPTGHWHLDEVFVRIHGRIIGSTGCAPPFSGRTTVSCPRPAWWSASPRRAPGGRRS